MQKNLNRCRINKANVRFRFCLPEQEQYLFWENKTGISVITLAMPDWRIGEEM
jgi:hypothetical protein